MGEPVGGEGECVDDLQRDVDRQMARPSLGVNIDLRKGISSSVSSTASPMPKVSTGKVMKELMAAREKEKEEAKLKKAALARETRRPENKVVAESSSSSSSPT